MFAILVLHILAGSFGLLTGLWAMVAPKRRGYHTRIGELYFWMASATALTGVALAMADLPNRWAFILLAFGMYACAWLAYRAAKRRRPRWILVHAPLQLLSYLFMTIATVTTLWDSITFGYDVPDGWGWLLPALIFYPMIAYVYFRERHRLGRSR